MAINDEEFDGFCYEKSDLKRQEFIKIKKGLSENNGMVNSDSLFIEYFIEDVILYYFFPYRIDIDFAFKQTLDYTSSRDPRRMISFNSIYNNIYLKKTKGNKK
jgi:hypothetical protein